MLDENDRNFCKSQRRQIEYQASFNMRVPWSPMPDKHGGYAYKLHSFETLFIACYLIFNFNTTSL